MRLRDVQFSFARKHIPKSTCINQHAFVVDPWSVLSGLHVHTFRFFDPAKKSPFPGTHVSTLKTRPLQPPIQGFGGSPKDQSYQATLYNSVGWPPVSTPTGPVMWSAGTRKMRDSHSEIETRGSTLGKRKGFAVCVMPQRSCGERERVI